MPLPLPPQNPSGQPDRKPAPKAQPKEELSLPIVEGDDAFDVEVSHPRPSQEAFRRPVEEESRQPQRRSPERSDRPVEKPKGASQPPVEEYYDEYDDVEDNYYEEEHLRRTRPAPNRHPVQQQQRKRRPQPRVEEEYYDDNDDYYEEEQPRRRRNSEQNNDDQKWEIDPVTGKKYRVLPGMERDAVKELNNTMNSGGQITYTMLRDYKKPVDDFDIENLNSTAEKFLAHLRVPPNKSEMTRLQKERAERMKTQNKIVSKIQEEEEKQDAIELEKLEEQLTKKGKRKRRQ